MRLSIKFVACASKNKIKIKIFILKCLRGHRKLTNYDPVNMSREQLPTAQDLKIIRPRSSGRRATSDAQDDQFYP